MLRILAKIFKYACSLVMFVAAFGVAIACAKDAGTNLRFLALPVMMGLAGIITCAVAGRKSLKGSGFMWWLYGAFVPVVSWIDVAMLGAESKSKAFMKGLAFSVMGLISFVAVLGGFVLPDTPKESPTPEIITTVPVSHDVVPASLTSMPAPKVSTDAEISALRAKKAEEQRKESAEYERQQQAERKRAEQEYLKQANTVVVTPRGKKYHYDTCRTLKGSYREMTIAQARRKGYAPCKVCDPPAQTVTLENSGGLYWGDNVYSRGKQVLDVD